MLEAMRRNSRGTIIYVLFGILIAVFVVNFGPGSSGCTAGLGSSFAVRVNGVEVSENEWRLYNVTQLGQRFSPQIAKQYRMKEILMDRVIERELLAQEAEHLGFAVSQKEAEDLVKTGKMYLLGRLQPWGDVTDGFDYKVFRRTTESFGLSVNKFLAVQQREMLADKVRQLMAGSVKVPTDEVRESYEQRETQVNLQFVRFLPRHFEDQVEVTSDDVAAYVKAHEADLKKEYEERSYLYKHVEKQAHVRHILVALPKDEEDEDKVAKAKKKADKAKRRVTGDEPKDFADVAKDLSEDEFTKGKGGDLGWHKKGYSGLGEAIDKLVFEGAKEGDVIGPERTDRGFEVVKVEGFRQGDLPFDVVAPELADAKLRLDVAKGKAKEAAAEAAGKVKAGEDLTELYPKPSDADESDPQKRALLPPMAEETGSFARKGELVPQIGVSSEVMKKAFEMKQGEVAGPIEVSAGQVVFRVKEKREADKKFFEEHKEEEIRSIARQKWADVIEAWSKQRCTESRDKGRIKVTNDMLAYEGAEPVNYTPCGGARF